MIEQIAGNTLMQESFIQRAPSQALPPHGTVGAARRHRSAGPSHRFEEGVPYALEITGLGGRNGCGSDTGHVRLRSRCASGNDQEVRRCLEQALAILTELRHHDAAQVAAGLRDLRAGPPERVLAAMASQATPRAQSNGSSGSPPGS